MSRNQTIKNKTPFSLEERGLFWADKKMIKHLDFLLKNKNSKNICKIPLKLVSNNSKSFEKTLMILKKHKLEMAFVDVTTPEINKIGFKVVKVIIPELQPLYLDENFKYLGGKRLYSMSKILGYTKNETKEEDLNKIPHPFL